MSKRLTYQHWYWEDSEHPRSFMELAGNVAIGAASDVIWDKLEPSLQELATWANQHGLAKEEERHLIENLMQFFGEAIGAAARVGYALALTQSQNDDFREWAQLALDKSGIVDYEMNLALTYIREATNEPS